MLYTMLVGKYPFQVNVSANTAPAAISSDVSCCAVNNIACHRQDEPLAYHIIHIGLAAISARSMGWQCQYLLVNLLIMLSFWLLLLLCWYLGSCSTEQH